MRKFAGCTDVAVVGVSNSKFKFGRSVCRTLIERGLTVYPVNPGMSECDGAACYPSLRDLQGESETAIVVVRPEQAMKIVDDAAEAGIKRLWFQRGADFAEAARSRGMEVVTGKCILMYAGEVTWIHRVLQIIQRLIGRY